MFQTILFPTDFSETAGRAYEKIKQLRTECSAQKIILMNVIDEREVDSLANLEGFYSIQLDNLRKEVSDELTRKAEQEFEPYKEELKQLGYQVEIRIVEGIPHEEIIKIANKEDAGLIVMGSHGKGIIQELLIGSTSEKVIRRSKCPVLIVK
ncbi:universal stress protein [bacterium]|nr:MAG: universal stress protein [bacterium]